MAATSPYSQNDYQAVSNFRPYELPINDIFKAISAQNMFWEQGAARIKSVYDNALNLKLSLEPNKELREKYVKDSEKQLTKLSAEDVSLPSVQRKGFALFKPLFQDEGIIYDDLTTRHYDKVRNDALMYRSKDSGKGYSDINMAYAMQGYNEFINSTDRMAGKSFYENRKEYTPYYDYTEDFSKALKDCKPSSIEGSSPVYNKGQMSGYLNETYSKGLSAAQVSGCLEGGLSPNGKRQLQIEGAVNYRNNIPVLASDTAHFLSGVTGNLSKQLQELSAERYAISNNKTMSTADKTAALKALDNNMTSVRDELDRTNHSVSKIAAGDFTDVQNNFETYAGSVYSYKKLLKKAMSSAFEERRQIYKADPVQLQAIKFTQDKYLNQLDFGQAVSLQEMKQEHDKEMKMWDYMYGGKDASGTAFKGADIYKNPLTGEITVNPDLLRETGNLTGSPEENDKVYSDLVNEVSNLSSTDQKNNLKLYNNMVSRGDRDKEFRETLLKGFNYGTTDDEWKRFQADHANNNFKIATEGGINFHQTSWFKAYSKQKPDDEDVNKWAYDNTTIKSAMGVINRKLEIGEKQVWKELGDPTKIDEQVNKVKSRVIKFYDPKDRSTTPKVSETKELTPADMRSFIEGKPSRLTYDPKSVTDGKVQGTNTKFLIDGKEVPYSSRLNILEGLTQVEKVLGKVSAKRAEVYSKLGFDREPWYFTPSDDKRPPAIVTSIKSLLPKDEKGKDLDVSVISSDFSGGIRVSVPGVKKGGGNNFTDDVIQRLRGTSGTGGIGTSVEATGDDQVTIKGTTYNVISQAINNPILAQAAYQLSSIAETTSFAQTQPGLEVPNSDIDIPVMIRGKQEIMTIKTYKDDNGPLYRVFIDTPTGTKEPIAPSKNAYELFEKIGRSPIDLNKPIK